MLSCFTPYINTSIILLKGVDGMDGNNFIEVVEVLYLRYCSPMAPGTVKQKRHPFQAQIKNYPAPGAPGPTPRVQPQIFQFLDRPRLHAKFRRPRPSRSPGS